MTKRSQESETPGQGQPARPIQSLHEDSLDRGPFVERRAAALINSETERSTGIVLGITGEWGSGKSSLLNLLREHIRKQYPNALVFAFDPWLVSGRNDLITEFLSDFELDAQSGARGNRDKGIQAELTELST